MSYGLNSLQTIPSKIYWAKKNNPSFIIYSRLLCLLVKYS